jgi:hypothetical protein
MILGKELNALAWLLRESMSMSSAKTASHAILAG